MKQWIKDKAWALRHPLARATIRRRMQEQLPSREDLYRDYAKVHGAMAAYEKFYT